MVRAGFTFENAIAVVTRLPEEVFNKGLCVKHRVIVGDSVRSQVITKPDEVVGNHGKADPVVQVNGRFIAPDTDNVSVTQLNSGKNQEHKADGIDPVPDAYRQRMQVNGLMHGSID